MEVALWNKETGITKIYVIFQGLNQRLLWRVWYQSWYPSHFFIRVSISSAWFSVQCAKSPLNWIPQNRLLPRYELFGHEASPDTRRRFCILSGHTNNIKKSADLYLSFYADENFLNPGFVTRQNAVYQKLLKKFIPKAHLTLQEQGLEPVLYTPSWFLTLFSKSLQDEKFYRFFDCFLV